MHDGDVNIDGYCALGDMGQGGALTEFTMDAGTVDIGLDPNTPDPPLDYLDSLIMSWYDTDAKSYLTINGGVMTVHGEIRFGMTTDHDGVAFDPVLNPRQTGSDEGELRININGGVLQAEDLIDAGTVTDHLITVTDGEFRILGSAVSETDMAALITAGDISCPNGYAISTDGGYTVLAATAGPAIPGDTNGDSVVNEFDAQVLATYWGSTTASGPSQGDFNGDQAVNVADAAILAANWGDHTGGEATAVPEPTALALLIGLAGLMSLRRRRA
jgi:hypothetical protein